MSDNIERRIWVLGAPDPEMAAIEQLLRECGERVAYALDERGERVTPATAYRCPVPDVPEGAVVYAVECVDVLPDGWWVRIDHHRPGDPGYGRPPSEFLAASSLGQVISELARTGALRRAIPKEHEIARWMANNRDLPVAEYNEMLRTRWFWSGREDMPGPNPYASDGTIARGVSWIYDGYAVAVHRNDFYFERRVALIPRPLIYAAAADHCLGAAYRGECPGVDPDALMRWRAESRAKFQGRTVEEVLADVERARESLRRAPTVVLDGVSPRRKREEGCPAEASRAFCVRDMRGVCTAHRLDHDCGCATQQCVTLCGAYAHGPCSVPELPDAASRDGEAYVTTVTVDGSGHPCRPKIVLGGCTTPDMVRAFLDHWAPAQGLVDAYGDPARGFAGAYLTTEAP